MLYFCFFYAGNYYSIPTACFASLSASSLPSTPECPFTFTKVSFIYPTRHDVFVISYSACLVSLPCPCGPHLYAHVVIVYDQFLNSKLYSLFYGSLRAFISPATLRIVAISASLSDPCSTYFSWSVTRKPP